MLLLLQLYAAVKPLSVECWSRSQSFR